MATKKPTNSTRPTADLPPAPAPAIPGLSPVPKIPLVKTVETFTSSQTAAANAAKVAADYLARRAATEKADREAREQSVLEDDASDTRPSDMRLKAFAEKIAQRFEVVSATFKDTPYDPTKNAEFMKYLNDQVAEAAMRFVRIGVVHAYDADAVSPDERARKMKEKGFAIGESAAGAANQKAAEKQEGGETTEKDAQGQIPPPTAGDVAFMNSPAMQAALDAGLNLDDD
jgi:hypothetical protein